HGLAQNGRWVSVFYKSGRPAPTPAMVHHSLADLPLSPTIAVAADPTDDADLVAAARELAVRLALPFVQAGDADVELLLTVTGAQLMLRVLRGEPALVGGHPIAID